MSRGSDLRWLRSITKEVADHPMPDLSWDRIEKGIFEKLETPCLRSSPPVASWHRPLAMAAVGALAAGLAFAFSPPTPKQQTPVFAVVDMTETAPAHACYTAREHEQYHAGKKSISFCHDDWARFRLQPQSRCRVLAIGDSVKLELLGGRLDVQVDKHSQHNGFAVRAGNLLVAVRGTEFSIEHQDSTLTVDVQQGVVAVGPVSRNEVAEGWIVSAPSLGIFDSEKAVRLTTRATMDRLPPTIAKEAETIVLPAETKEKPLHREDKKPVFDATLPLQLTSESAATAIQSVLRRIESCHRATLPEQDDEVTIRTFTTLTLRVAPDGKVIEVAFDPPLSPSARACSDQGIQDLSFPRARGESVLTLPISM